MTSVKLNKRLLIASLLLTGVSLGAVNPTFLADASTAIANNPINIKIGGNNNNKGKNNPVNRVQNRNNNKNDKNKNDKNKNDNNNNKNGKNKNDNKGEKICDNYTRNKGQLYAEVDLKDGRAKIFNKSDNCSYRVGVVSYKIFNKQTGKPQELFDYKYGIVKKNSQLTLNIRVPNCAYQFDTFEGQLGNKNGIDHVNDGRRNMNKEVCRHGVPTPTPSNPVTPIPTKPVTPTPTRPVTPTPTRPVTPTPTHPVTPTPTTPVTPTPSTPVTPTVTVTPSVLTPTPTSTNSGGITNTNNNNNSNSNENNNNITVNPVIENNVSNTVTNNTTERIVYYTKDGQPVYEEVEYIETTPDTGAGMLSFLTLLPSALAGFVLRKRIA